MKKVMEQYAEHISRIHSKAYYKQHGYLTAAQKRGMSFYTAAIETVQALIDAPTPEWVVLKFKTSRRA
jgi:hypothetical protein